MRYKFGLGVLLVFFLTFCKKENMCDCVKSTGPENEIYRDVTGFKCISVYDKMEIYLTQGPVFEVKVQAGRNLQKLIKTVLEDETLKVFNANRCNWVRGYKHTIKVFITAPRFKYILNNGIGSVESTGTIVQDTIVVKTSGSGSIQLAVSASYVKSTAQGNGDVTLSGTTNSLFTDFTGTNYLFAGDLAIQNYAYIHTASIGKGYLHAPENGMMEVIIDQSGNVFYKGNPTTIRLTRNNKGNLIKE